MTSRNEEMIYNMDPAYQVGYTQQEVDGKSQIKFPVKICGTRHSKTTKYKST